MACGRSRIGGTLVPMARRRRVQGHLHKFVTSEPVVSASPGGKGGRSAPDPWERLPAFVRRESPLLNWNRYDTFTTRVLLTRKGHGEPACLLANAKRAEDGAEDLFHIDTAGDFPDGLGGFAHV